ncbi:MAG: hypothetical protein SFU27_00380, partial [Thermonemataceae bacterium]|nr:hypothetical protein [Thermonemataceae bacterium]
MAFSIRKIQNKILLSFSLMIVLAGVIATVTFLYQRKINDYHVYKGYLSELRQLSTKVDAIQKDFLAIDTRDEVYISSGRSKHINQFGV